MPLLPGYRDLRLDHFIKEPSGEPRSLEDVNPELSVFFQRRQQPIRSKSSCCLLNPDRVAVLVMRNGKSRFVDGFIPEESRVAHAEGPEQRRSGNLLQGLAKPLLHGTPQILKPLPGVAE